MNYHAIKIEEVEEKRFFKTVKVKIAHGRRGRRSDVVTLNTPEIKMKFWKLLQKNNLNIREKHIDIGTKHTFPPPLVEDEKKDVWTPISPSKEDMIKEHVFFQLVGIPVAKLAKIEDEMIINDAIAEFLRKLMKRGFGEKTKYYDIDKMRIYNYGYLLPEYEKFAELAKEYADKIAWAYRIHIKDGTRTDIIEHTPLIAEIAKVAADLANYIGEHLAKRGDLPEDLEDNEHFKKYVELLSEVFPKADTPKSRQEAPKERRVAKLKTETKPSSLALEAQRLLGLLSGLKFAGYSSDAVKNAVESLELEVERLSENPAENLELIGLYCLVIRALEGSDFEGAEELLKSLSGW